jgi:hypothetical protein
MLQVSAGAKTECKLTAWVPSFNFTEKIDRAVTPLMAKLRKNMNFDMYRSTRQPHLKLGNILAFCHFLGGFEDFVVARFSVFCFVFFCSMILGQNFGSRRIRRSRTQKKQKAEKRSPSLFFVNV